MPESTLSRFSAPFAPTIRSHLRRGAHLGVPAICTPLFLYLRKKKIYLYYLDSKAEVPMRPGFAPSR